MQVDEILKHVIEVMIEKGIICFDAFSWCYNIVDMTVKSDIFEDDSFVMSVPEDDWNCGPAEAVAAELTELLINGTLVLKHNEM